MLSALTRRHNKTKEKFKRQSGKRLFRFRFVVAFDLSRSCVIEPRSEAGGFLIMADKLEFKKGDFVVYPAHGVGRIEGIDACSMSGMDVMLYSISFEQDRMRLKVPVSKAKTSGLRRLSSRDRIKEALSTLQGRSKIRRVMWSRRAQEYESKINSGDPVSIAEVVRDLHRGTDQPEQSYSERQIYQAALERLARELAAVEKIDQHKATTKLETVLTKEREKRAA